MLSQAEGMVIIIIITIVVTAITTIIIKVMDIIHGTKGVESVKHFIQIKS